MKEENGGLEEEVIECMRQVWRTGINEQAQIHADYLKEHLAYWKKYKSDCEEHGLEHIRHYFNNRTGEFFYEVCDEPSDLQRFIDENLGIKGYE